MPACGLFIIDEAIAACPIVLLAAGVGDMAAGAIAVGDIAFMVSTTMCAIVEEVDVVLVAMPFMPGMLAISILAVVSFQFLDRGGELDAGYCSSNQACLQ